MKLLARLIIIGDDVVDDEDYRAKIPLDAFVKPKPPPSGRKVLFNELEPLDEDVDATVLEERIQVVSISSPEPVVDSASENSSTIFN